MLAEGPFLVGLNEVRVGLPVPELLLRALASLVGARHAARLAVNGLLVGPEEALRVGSSTSSRPPTTSCRARSRGRATCSSARAAPMTETRARVRRPLVESFDTLDARGIDAIVEQWFSAEAQATLQGLAARLSKR